MKFYTSCHLHKNDILLRGYDNGTRFQDKVPCKPYLFLPSKKADSEYRTLKGMKVDKIAFDSVYAARDFLKRYEDVSGFEYYGSTNFVFPFLNDRFPGRVDYDPKVISTVNFDIEVYAPTGFPKPELAEHPITAITLERNNQLVVLGTKEYSPKLDNVKYIKCDDEANLLLKFLDCWRSKFFSPDIITGWNIEQFDVPYLVNRLKKVLGSEFSQKLSPWQIVSERDVINKFGGYKIYDLFGIQTLDYLALYKKFSFQMQEQYSLDHIANVELNERKLDYSEYSSLNDLYEKDFVKYIDYNIKDVLLVKKLDDKLKLIDQALAIAYDAKVNYQDSYTSVRMWDVIIHNYLIDQKIVVPPMKKNEKENQIIGAFVKDPQVGQHKWVVSFDLNSLYPHLIMQYNISPETLVGKIGRNLTVDNILNGDLDDFKSELVAQNYTIAATGFMFDRDFQGFLPKLMEKMYNDRVVFKNEMIQWKKKHEANPTQETERMIAQTHNMQLAKKIQLNSAYGALSNLYFRWFDVRLAESITVSGQLSIRWIENKINQYLNKLLKTEGTDYVIACDTDSMYITLDRLVSAMFTERNKTATTEEIVNFIDKACVSQIEPFIDKCYAELAEYVNAFAQKMKMKREAIADKGIWLAKKHYILNVYNNEGVQYHEPKLKMMGIEAVKSSTPKPCREYIKKALKIMMSGTEEQLIEAISMYREDFKKLEFEDVAFPRTCTNLTDYHDSSSIYKKGTPLHVRGSLLYNDLISKHKLTKAQPVNNGDKIKYSYLLLPNPIKENVISCPGILPRELGINKYIDYDTQFDKAFLEFVKSVTEKIGWKIEKRATLEDFFGSL